MQNIRNQINKYGLLFSLILFISASYIYLSYGPQKPCSKTIYYHIGTVDSRFNLNENEIRNSINNAATVWNEALGKKIIEEKLDVGLSINFIYDERQIFTKYTSDFNKALDEKKKILNEAKQEYEEKQRVYEVKLNNLNNKIEIYNQNPKEEEYNKLSQEQTELNNLKGEISSSINYYNNLALDFNNSINIYNNNPSVGKEFDAGTYIENGKNKKEINVYEFEDVNKLTRLIAHEFGHSIGLDHNNNSDSIMYRLNYSNQNILSEEDIKSLITFCNTKKKLI